MLGTLQYGGNLKPQMTTEKLQVVKQCHSKKSNWIEGANFTEKRKLASPWPYPSNKRREASLMSHTCIIESQVLWGHTHNSMFLSKMAKSFLAIGLFTVVCLVTWPLNESEAVRYLVMIETSQLLLGKFLLISLRTASLTYYKKSRGFQSKQGHLQPHFHSKARELSTRL